MSEQEREQVERAVHEVVEAVDALSVLPATHLSLELGDMIYASTKLDKLIEKAWGKPS